MEKLNPKFKIGESVLYYAQPGTEPILGKVNKIVKLYSKNPPYDNDVPQYFIQTNNVCSYLQLDFIAEENELSKTDIEFRYDTEAEQNLMKSDPESYYKLGIVTEYNKHLFLNKN